MKYLFNALMGRCFLFVMVLQLFVIPSLKAANVTFPANSLIIPMDTTYQDCGTWPAFGLIYQLLLNGVPVSWAIADPKTAYNQTDFVGPASAIILNSPIPTTCSGGNPVPATVPASYAFTAGPYIIDGTDPAILATATSVINAWWAGGAGHSPIVNQPVVIKATSSFTATVNIVLNKAPVIAIEDVTPYETIAEGYMTTAGIPQSTGSPPYASGWSFIGEGTPSTPGSIAGGGLFQTGNVCQQRIFDVYVTPHNTGFAYSLTDPTNTGTITYAQLDNFVYLGGGWIASCFSLQTNEDSMADLTINGNAAVKALFRTSVTNQGGFLIQGASKPYQTPSPSGATCANAAFPTPSTANTGSRWVPDSTNLALPIIQGILPTMTPDLTSGMVSSWTSPPADQPIGVTPTNYPNYWAQTRRISYLDTDLSSEPITNPGTSERYDSIIDGVYHNGTGAGKVSFFGGHQYNVTLPYHNNPDASYLRAFYNSLLLNGNSAVQLKVHVSPNVCLGSNAVLSVMNAGTSTATLDSNLVLTLAPDFTYVSTNVPYPPPDTIAGKTLTWVSTTIPTVSAGSTAISINVLTSILTPLGNNEIATLSVQYSDPFGYEYMIDTCTGVNVATVTTAAITSTNPQTLCALTTTTATVSGNNPNSGSGETGLWTQVSGPAATITTPGLPTTTITGLTGTHGGSTGSNTYVFEWTISSTGGFCTSSAQTTITVYEIPAQAGSISGPTPVCSGSTNTYSVINDPIATSYTWTLPSGWTGSSTTNSITATPTAMANSGNISVTANNGSCSSTPQTLAITVTVTPVQPGTISGPTTVCSGTMYTYSVTPVPGATAYTWTLPPGWTGASTTNSIVATPSSTSGNITVKANNGSCDSAPQTLAVTATASPAQPSAITGPGAVCSGNAYTYSVTNDPSATSYTWIFPSGWTATSTTNSIVATPTAAAVSGTISVTANNSSCTSIPQTLAVTATITPDQPGPISGPAAVCSGVVYTYSVTPVSGATGYTWTLPTGWTGSSTTNSINATAGSTGTISVTANTGSCSSVPATLAVTVNNIPAQPGAISGPAAVCSGTAYTYSIAAVSGATSYTWSLPSGWAGTSTTTSISATLTGSATSGSISVVANNGLCSSIPQMLPVTVTITPDQPGAISGPATVCSGTMNTYSVIAVPYATSYTWTLPSGWTGISTTNSINATASLTSGNIIVTANNGSCFSTSQTLAINVTVTPIQPGSISGPTTVCTGTTNSYSVAAVPGASSYTWILPSGWTGTSVTNSINATASISAVSGNITVTANAGASCSSAPQTLFVTVIPTPAPPGAISGPAAVCSGITYTYSIAAVPGAASYTWILPSGWTGSSTTNSISVMPTDSAVSGNIIVTADNGSCASTPQTLAVSVTITPNEPGSISGPTDVCSGVTYTYSIAAVPGATGYTWTLPSGWTGTSMTSSIAATPSSMSGTVSVTANNGTCSSTSQILPVTVTSTPSGAGPITGPVATCSGIPSTYSIAAVANATGYIWSLPSGWSGSSTTNTIIVTPSTSSGTISVTPFNDACSGTPAILSVIATQSPADAGPVSGPSTVCSGITTTYSIAPVANATSYVWDLPSGWTGTSTTDSITVMPSTTGGTISVTPLNGGCPGLPSLLAVAVTTTPDNAGPITGSETPCSGVSTTYSIAPVVNATSYMWALPSGWSGSSATNSINVIPSSISGTISVTPFNGSCAGLPATLSATVTQTPGNAGSISGSQTPCSGASTTYSISSVPNSTSYIWTLPAGWTGTSITNSITVIPSTTSGTITVTPANGSCTGAPASIPVTVTAAPIIGPISGAAEVCYGSTNVYFTTVVPAATYVWTLPPGWSIIGSSTGYAITALASGLSGDITVTANSPNGICSSAAQTYPVTVHPLPAVVITPPAFTITKGSSTTLTAGGASTYLWSPGALTGSSITVSPLSTTTYTVTGTDAMGCINTASATVTVVNAVIVANPNSGSLPDGAAGGVAVANVLANDTLNGLTPTLATVQLTPTAPFNPQINLNPDGSVTVIPGAPAGVYTIGYTICEIANLSNCSSTTVQVTVGAAPIVANPDSGTVPNGANGGIAVPNVLANDTLNGATPTLSNVNLSLTGAPNPYISLNSNGSVSAAPGTPAGVYTIGYSICETINPTNCSSTTVTVTVNPPAIAAHPDSGTVPNGTAGGVAIPNILLNDTLNGVTPTTSNVSIAASSPFDSNVVINSNGSVSVPPNTPAGVYTAGYTICEILNPTNCSSSTVQVTVGAASIVANPNMGSVNGAAGGVAVSNVLENDTLNGIEATLSIVNLTASSPTSPYVTLNPNGSVSLAPGTPVGVYTIGYTISEKLNPTNCSSTTVQVTATISSIVAIPDFGTVPNGTTGGISVMNVLANDTLNGVTPTLSTVTLMPASSTSPYATLNPNGSVSVAPNTPAGVYTIDYQICEILNPTNCSSTIVKTTVGAAPIFANPDSGSVPEGSTGGVAVGNVLANDTLNGVTPTLADVNLSATSPFSPYVTLNLDGSVSVLPGTPAGVYEIGYKICHKLNPTNCSSSMVQVSVGAPPIAANPSSGIVPNGTAGGIAVPNILAGDTINGQPTTLLNVNLSVVGTPSPYLELDQNTGAVLVLPGTPAGVYMLQYQICDKQNPANCAISTVTVTVFATQPQPPIDPAVCQIKQKFIGGTDFMDVIKWKPPVNGPAIVTYRVYKNAALTELIGEVLNTTGSCDTVTFVVHHRKKGQISVYYIVSVDAEGQVSNPVKVSN